MMLNRSVSGGSGGGTESTDTEETRLLKSSSSTHDASSFLFNDLTYSDDEDNYGTDDWEDGELGEGYSGSISSPDTAALLDQIDALGRGGIPVQQTSHPHLMHPLARGESINSQATTDDGSALAYSISSTVAEDDPRLSLSPPPNYGALDLYDTSPVFRPPESGLFDNSPSSGSISNLQYALQYTNTTQQQQQQQQQQQTRASSSIPNLNPSTSSIPNLQPRSRQIEKFGVSSSTLPQSTSSTQQGIDTTNNRSYRPITPLSFMNNESPVTSATADTNESPSSGAKQYVQESEPEKERITKILSEEAIAKRLKRHRRLKRIKKVAEAREEAVQKVRGIEQKTRCNDALFAFIFLCQFLLVTMSALAFGPGALRDKIYGSLLNRSDNHGDGGEEGTLVDYDPFEGLHTDDIVIMDEVRHAGMGVGAAAELEEGVIDAVDHISHIDYINVIQLVCIASGYAAICSVLALGFMMTLSKNFLHVTLIFTDTVCVVWTVLGLAFSPNWIIPITGAIAVVLSTIYTAVVWDRITFAATNFSVALKGMRSTLDVPFVGLCVLAAAYLWTILWICAFIGTFDFLNDDEELSNNWMSVVIVFFLFSYYWTFQVIKGISQTTVASIIDKWWDMSEDEPLPLCSSALASTLSRNLIRSFGAICLGSLIVDPCILLVRLSNFSRLAKPKLKKLKTSINPSSGNEQTDPDCTLVTDCSCPMHSSSSPYNDSIISRNVNQWSYTYIGIYGYKFWESGSKANQLFEARGWTNVVQDDLIMTIMSLSSLIIGASSGCLGIIIEEVDGYSFTSLDKPIATAFCIGAFVGYFLSSAFLSIVEGSVNAILVCYASAPVEFHANHHRLSEDMKRVWRTFWLRASANPSHKK